MNTQSSYEDQEKQYISLIIEAYKSGKENAFEAYQQHYEQREGESDIEFIERCAALDFSDGEDSLVYLDLWESRNLDDFTQAYIEAALWSSTDTDSTGKEITLDAVGAENIAPETMQKMMEDCRNFQHEQAALLSQAYCANVYVAGARYSASNAGHDFWLTRCGHGAGFWDRGLSDIGEALTKQCGFRTKYPEIDLYIGDDGKIYA